MFLLNFFDDFGQGIGFFLLDNELNATPERLIPGRPTWWRSELPMLAEEITTVANRHT